jgi:glycosyltransferase involved in cell wall biosynthesis
MTTAAIIPAYNEARTIPDVIRAFKASNRIAEIIVIDDGSTDDTAEQARAEGVRVISQANTGKAGAMVAGAKNTNADVLFFSDADLVGFAPEHIEALLRPIFDGSAGMTVGMRDRGRATLWLMKHVLPIIGGERVMRRDVFLRMVARHERARFGIETVMNAYCTRHRIPIRLVRIVGVHHIIKEARYGFWVGLGARIRMIGDIVEAEIRALFSK